MYTCPLRLEPPAHLPLCAPSLGCHGAPGLSSLGQRVSSHSAICFTNGSIYVPRSLSQFIPPSPSPIASTSLFCVFASPLLPCKQVHGYHLSRSKYGMYPELRPARHPQEPHAPWPVASGRSQGHLSSHWTHNFWTHLSSGHSFKEGRKEEWYSWDRSFCCGFVIDLLFFFF